MSMKHFSIPFLKYFIGNKHLISWKVFLKTFIKLTTE